METDDEVKSDLYALKQLYWLLQSIIGRGVPYITPENVCKSLDNRALQLLKNLLDNATQEKLSKIKADCQSNILNMQASAAAERDDDGVFSKQVSKSIEEIDAHILSLHVHTSGTRFSDLNHVKPESTLIDMDRSPSRPASCYVHGLRIPSTTRSSSNVDYRIRTANPKPGSDYRANLRQIIVGPTYQLEPENPRRSQQLLSEPESYSSGDGSYTTEEENSAIPSEVSETDDYDYDDEDDDDDDEVQSSSNVSSHSSYSTAKDETNPNYVLRRKVQDYSEKATRISTLRRIKNKLKLIFHHHHHHHHHHHPNYRRDRNPNHGSWKLVRRMFHPNSNNKKAKYDRRNDIKATRRRSMVKRSGGDDGVRRGGGPGKAGHFRALVEAWMRHVRGGGGKNPAVRGNRKRIGWLKMGNHRRGRVRVGFKKTNQPPKLKL